MTSTQVLVASSHVTQALLSQQVSPQARCPFGQTHFFFLHTFPVGHRTHSPSTQHLPALHSALHSPSSQQLSLLQDPSPQQVRPFLVQPALSPVVGSTQQTGCVSGQASGSVVFVQQRHSPTAPANGPHFFFPFRPWQQSPLSQHCPLQQALREHLRHLPSQQICPRSHFVWQVPQCRGLVAGSAQ